MKLSEFFKSSQLANIREAIENETIINNGEMTLSYESLSDKIEKNENLDQADLIMVIRALEGDLSYMYRRYGV